MIFLSNQVDHGQLSDWQRRHAEPFGLFQGESFPGARHPVFQRVEELLQSRIPWHSNGLRYNLFRKQTASEWSCLSRCVSFLVWNAVTADSCRMRVVGVVCQILPLAMELRHCIGAASACSCFLSRSPWSFRGRLAWHRPEHDTAEFPHLWPPSSPEAEALCGFKFTTRLGHTGTGMNYNEKPPQWSVVNLLPVEIHMSYLCNVYLRPHRSELRATTQEAFGWRDTRHPKRAWQGAQDGD